MHDNVRIVHIDGRKWKWELMEWKKFPIVVIRSEYGSKFIESADYFIDGSEMYLGYRVNIVPSKIEKYICEKILKIQK